MLSLMYGVICIYRAPPSPFTLTNLIFKFFFLILVICTHLLNMLPMFPRSKVLNFVYSTATKLEWTWDFFLQTFSHPYNINTVSENSSARDELGVRIFEAESRSLLDSVKCAVCLCKIEEEEEVRELRCNHLFHRVCLDRWLGYGRMTCPLCRNNLNNTPYCSHHFTDIYQEVILFDFFKVRLSDRRQWWLR